MNILEQPLVAYAGIVFEHGSLTFYGHGKFIPGWTPSIETCSAYMKEFGPEKLYLIHGDLSNPYFTWPMYAVKT